MNSQAARIWTTLRYVALVPVLAFGILSIIASSGGGDDDESGVTISLTASAISSTEIALSWTGPDVIDDRYRIFMDGTLIVELRRRNSWVIPGLAPNTSYCFQVTAEVVVFVGIGVSLDLASNVACATTLPA